MPYRINGLLGGPGSNDHNFARQRRGLLQTTCDVFDHTLDREGPSQFITGPSRIGNAGVTQPDAGGTQTLETVLHQGMLIHGGLARVSKHRGAVMQQQGTYQRFIGPAHRSLGQQGWRGWHHHHRRHRLDPCAQGAEMPTEHHAVHGLGRDHLPTRQRLKRQSGHKCCRFSTQDHPYPRPSALQGP